MYIEITPRDWAFAALLGEARRRSNEATRKSNRDRGNIKNIHVDLMGSISEILAMKHLRRIMTAEEKQATIQSMFRPEGGGGKFGADLNLSARNLRLDVKTFDCEDNKRFFAINGSKHNDLKGVCDGYLCIICPKYATQAYIIDHVPYDQISNWPQKTLGNYGDSSYNLPIHDFMAKHADAEVLRRLKGQKRHSRDAIATEINSEATRAIFHRLFISSDRYIRTLKSISSEKPDSQSD